MGWRAKKKENTKGKKPLFSPKVVVQAVQTAANTFRYVARKVANIHDYEEDHILDKPIKGKGGKVITPTFESHGDGILDYAHGGRRRNHNYGYYNAQAVNTKATKVKSKYAWEPTEWSAFNWNTYYSKSKDDDTNLFAKEPESYITPTNEQIAKEVKVYMDESYILIKEAARVCYFKMLDDKDYINPNCQISSDEYQRKKDLYDSIYETYLPGTNPLEQAIAVYWQVTDKEARANRVKDSQRRSSHTVDFKREDYADPTINHQLEDNYLSRRYKLDILNKISILGDLGNQFKVEKEVGEYEVPFSDVNKTRLMKNYEELDRIDLYQRAFPNFDLKFYTKDLFVTVPVSNTERKQKIIILLDFSGSMSELEKQQWVNAILVDRFRYVIKGEAEIFFSFFVSSTSELRFHHIATAEDVNQFWKEFSNDPNGNTTNIGRIVDYVAKEVAKGKLHNLKIDLSQDRPEILIINDGQDSVDQERFNYKVNAISLMEFSDELKDLCLATTGKQVQITEENEVYSYAMEDGELVRELVYQG